MKKTNITKRVAELHEYYDRLLDERIKEIATKSEVPEENFVKINPAEFCEKNAYQKIDNYKYQKIDKWITREKKDAQTFLVSPLDPIEETVEQVSYKTNTNIERTIRASKCKIKPLPTEVAQAFFIRNHRQRPPLLRTTAVSFGLVFKGELVAVMTYDISHGAVRGAKKNYELVRLAIAKGAKIHGGASKLQKACERSLVDLGEREIYSFSNATLNSGAVYKALGFEEKKIDGGQPFVILKNNVIVRLINLYPKSTDGELALRGWIKTHVGGNKMWIKKI